MRINREIRAPRVRVIDKDGEQIGVPPHRGGHLIERNKRGSISSRFHLMQNRPLCKIIDYGKYRYQITKKEKESKKSQHQVKVKEIKVKPNTDEHDIQTKFKHARDFVAKGDKVRITCTFRGREMMHTEFGEKIVKRMCEDLADVAVPEAPAKMFGKILSVVLAPGAKKTVKGVHRAENENAESRQGKI